MRLADVCEFYSPDGGGVKTYVNARWRAAAAAGHHVSVIAPSHRDHVTPCEGGELVEVKAPRHPVDPRYHIFWSAAPVHAALDRVSPDIIEASSPWRGAWLVASYPGRMPKTMFMHEEPVMKWAYGIFDRWFERATIDSRVVPWFWRHLKRLYGHFDQLVCAAPSVAARLQQAGIPNTATIPMGVEDGIFSAANRDEALRARLLSSMKLPPDALLLIAIGRMTAEKRWPVIIGAALKAAQHLPLGLVALGGGHANARVTRLIGQTPHILLQPPIPDRSEYARFIASADALLHASNAETFGLAAAEALASGLPLIAPDEGAVVDLAQPGASFTYRTGDTDSAADAIIAACQDLGAARRAARALPVPTLEDHFTDLFARYERLIRRPVNSGFLENQASAR
ncbi:glycosyltransferase [Pacificimonas sp. ICDLI1SI03]